MILKSNNLIDFLLNLFDIAHIQFLQIIQLFQNFTWESIDFKPITLLSWFVNSILLTFFNSSKITYNLLFFHKFFGIVQKAIVDTSELERSQRTFSAVNSEFFHFLFNSFVSFVVLLLILLYHILQVLLMLFLSIILFLRLFFFYSNHINSSVLS